MVADSSQPIPSRRRSGYPFPSFRLRRADCIRLAIIGVLLTSTLLALPAGGQESESVLAQINQIRLDGELAPVDASPALDTVAAAYLDAIIADQCVCPAAGGQEAARRLLDDVAAALGDEAALLDTGLVSGYDKTPDGAIATVIHNPANAAAILGLRMELAGIATGVIAPDARWLGPPPGSDGPAIDLSGFTVVVIVIAGTSR
jgi:hypothetical protein